MFMRTGNGSGMARAWRAASNRSRIAQTSTALAVVLIVSACTAGSVLEPRPEIDVGTHTAAVPTPSTGVASSPTKTNARPTDAPTYAMQPMPAPSAATEPLPAPGEAPDPAPEQIAAKEAEPELAPGPRTLGTLTVTRTEAGMTPVSASMMDSLAAPDEQPAAAERPEPEEAPVQVAAMPAPAPEAPEPKSVPTAVAYPRVDAPISRPRAPEPPVVKPVMPADELACRRELKRIGATFTDIPRIGEGGSCGIAWPVRVTALSGNIRMKPAATLNCEMALTFARWTKKELAPAARLRYLSGIKRINNGTYSCRRIAGSRRFSAHSKGNAIDIMSIDLENGRNLDVRKPGFFAFRQRGLLNTVRADGCSYFTTVLGPGYNHDHRNHFHFDLMQRKSGHRACH